MSDMQRTEVAPQLLEQVQQYVAQHCPDLLDAECSVQARRAHSPSAEMMSKVKGKPTEQTKANEVHERRPDYTVAAAPSRPAGRSAAANHSTPHYTVTLRKNVRTDNGALLPRILRFVVDSGGRILKATTSKLAATSSRRFEAGA